MSLWLQASETPQATPSPEPTPIHAWRFEASQFTGGTIKDQYGDLNLRLEKGGLLFTDEGAADAVLIRDNPRPLDLKRDIDPSSMLPSDAFSMATWIRVDQPTSWAAAFSAIADNGPFERGWASGCNGDQFYLGLVGSEGDDKITYLFSNTRAEPRRWYHLVATYDGKTMRVFVNGELDAESRVESGPVLWPDTVTLALGSYVDEDERHHLQGALHSVALYDIALDADDVASLHQRDQQIFPEPVQPEDSLAAQSNAPTVGWPTYRHDAQRSGATAEQLNYPFVESWRHQAESKPQPSWPEPAESSYWQNIEEIVPRVVFDRCFQPVSNGEVVLYGSSSDDHIRCLELNTGDIRWEHATNGPVRFAPIIDGDGALVASDDGTLRRLNLVDGSIEWIQRLAPSNQQVIGNDRMISAWPLRTGPVLDRGQVSVTVGLFPKFGTWATTLDAETGDVLWRTELSNTSPQGYLLASPRRLFIPTGRTSPIMLGRSDGRSLGQFKGSGGTFAVLVEDQLLTGPGSRGRLELASQQSKETIAGFDAKEAIVIEDLIVLAREKTITAIDRPRLLQTIAARKTLEKKHTELLARREQGAQVDEELEQTAIQLGELQDELLACELWKKAVPTTSLALANDVLVIGTPNGVILVNAKTGAEIEDHLTNGSALGLAIANGQLLVATDRGTLHCFGTTQANTSVVSDFSEAARLGPDDQLAKAIRAAGMDRGLALVLGATNARQSIALANELRLHVIILEPNEANADALREEIRDANFYGNQVVVHTGDFNDLGIDKIANVLVIENPIELTDRATIANLVRPAGGILFPGPSPEFTEIPSGFQEFTTSPRALIRDPLVGSGNWTHAYADAANTTSSGDALLNSDYALRWFGGPGAQRMVDRHLRTTASLSIGGRLFIPGKDIVIAADAYNGFELWSVPLPGFTRTGAPFDGGWWAVDEDALFAAVNDQAVELCTRTGNTTQTVRMPPRALAACAPPEDPLPRGEWGWLALEGTSLLGSASLPGTARLEQSRSAIVDQYSDGQPLATSRALFSIDRPTGRTNWVYHDGVIVNSTISARDGRIVFVETRAEKAFEDLDGRVLLKDLREGVLYLVALDATTGRRLWRTPIQGERFDHALFVALAPEQVIVVGSTNNEQSVQYHIAAHNPQNGSELWRAEHANNRPGVGGDHGEQVHHPVLLEDVLIAEPRAYDLATGEPIDPTAGNGFFIDSRVGCGTISASQNSLFFRDGNPVVIDLSSGSAAQKKLTQASRQGCWVNVIPAQGMALIPESSSGCVCGYSLQTSLGLVPIEQ